jgi:O-antigen ligase
MITEENRYTIWASGLLVMLPAVIVISPSLTALLEIALYALFILNPELRKRFVASLTQPIVIFGFLLCFFIIISSLWSAASWDIKLEHIRSWRKILLLPMAACLIDTPKMKDRFLFVFIIAIAFYALLSWFSYASDIHLFNKEANELLRNHATQGMIFFVGSFVCISFLLYKKNISLKLKIIFSLFTLLILSNFFIVSTSRSGYLIGAVLTVCFGLFLRGKKAMILAPTLFVVLLGVLYISPTPHQRILQMWDEIINVQDTENITSGGARVVFIKNTIPIILDSPIFGHGLKSMSIEYAKQVIDIKSWKGNTTRDPHNQYFLLLAEQGVIGLLIFFSFIGSCFFQKVEPIYKYLGVSVLLGWMATSLFNGHFSASVEGKFIFLWCGAMLAMPLSKHQKDIATYKKFVN